MRLGEQLFKDITGGSHPEAPGWEVLVKCKNQQNLYVTFLFFCFLIFGFFGQKRIVMDLTLECFFNKELEIVSPVHHGSNLV